MDVFIAVWLIRDVLLNVKKKLHLEALYRVLCVHLELAWLSDGWNLRITIHFHFALSKTDGFVKRIEGGV